MNKMNKNLRGYNCIVQKTGKPLPINTFDKVDDLDIKLLLRIIFNI